MFTYPSAVSGQLEKGLFWVSHYVWQRGRKEWRGDEKHLLCEEAPWSLPALYDGKEADLVQDDVKHLY